MLTLCRPDAISSVIAKLRSTSGADSGYATGVLLLLLYAIKELATGRLQRTRAILQSTAPEVLQVLGSLYTNKVHSWSSGNDQSQDADLSLLALRILRRLLIAGYDFPNRHAEVKEFWTTLNCHRSQMLPIVLQPSFSNHVMYSLVEKHLIQMSKLHLNMAKLCPAGYALLPESTSLTKSYWQLVHEVGKTWTSSESQVEDPAKIGTDGDADEEEVPTMEKLCLKGLLLLRACTKMVFDPAHTFKYQQAEDKIEKKRAMETIRLEILTEPLVLEIMETLVSRFFVFRQKDLKQWEEEPEEWERREEGEGDAWEFSVRQCAEKLFLDLVINFKELLLQPLVDVFVRVSGNAGIPNRICSILIDNLDSSDVFLKDSVYAAMGLSAAVLADKVNLAAFLENTLAPEAQIQRPDSHILRRRIAILLGQWLPVQEGLNRPLVYQIFQSLLDKGQNDQVVRVTAARQLQHVIEPFEFNPEEIMPYAPVILERSIDLIEEMELLETKMALLDVVHTLIYKMGHHVRSMALENISVEILSLTEYQINPFADQIIAALPRLWDQASEEYLMRQTILGVLSSIVSSMKQDSHRFQQLMLPLIQNAVSNPDMRFYLLEDALDLWIAILVQTREASPDLISLAQHIFLLFELESETLRKAFEITEAYILLMPRAMLELSSQFFTAFDTLLENVKSKVKGTITHLIETLFIVASLGGAPSVDILTTVLERTAVWEKLIAGLKSAHDSHQATGPNRPSTDIDGIVETDYFSVLARIALGSPSAFVSAISSTVTSDFSATDWLFVEWFSHFDNIGDPSKKKLMCLALTALTSNPAISSYMLSKLQQLMSIWTDVITELTEGIEDESRGDCLVYHDKESLAREGESADEGRRRDFSFVDPVHTVSIKYFVRQHLRLVVEGCGGRFEEVWLANVDRDVVAAFGALGVMANDRV